MSSKDLLLIAVGVGGALLGLALPSLGAVFTPYAMAFNSGLMFFAFLSLDLKTLVGVRRRELVSLIFWSFCKLVFMPVLLYFLCLAILPEWALAVLIMSGISMAMSSPFMARFFGGGAEPMVRMVALSSLLVPLTLPFLLKALAGYSVAISFARMAGTLALVIILPILLVWLLKLLWPGMARLLNAKSGGICLAMIGLVDMAVFAPYSEFVMANLMEVLLALAICVAVLAVHVGVVLFFTGISRGRLSLADGLMSQAFFNVVLAMVFSAEHFGPREALLSGVCILPFFLQLGPLKFLLRRKVILNSSA